MVRRHPAKFGDHRHCGSDDILFLVAKEEISDALTSIRHFCLVSKGHRLKARGISYY